MATISCVASSQVYSQSTGKDLLYIFSGSFLLILAARLAIPFTWSPIPVTCQTLAALFLGIQLGPKRGALAVVTYLVEVSLGLPVLRLGLSNPAALTGITAGYLWGMVLQAYFIGNWMERAPLNCPGKILLGMICAVLLQLAMGALWLGYFVGYAQAWKVGFMPFIAIELLKAICLLNVHTLFKRGLKSAKTNA